MIEIRHPKYLENFEDYVKWRLTYRGGQDFINRYLKRSSKRETPIDFAERKAMTYCPAFAKVAINRIKNSIYQRLIDIVRIGGPESYQKAVNGEFGGVDLIGSTMQYFIGQKVLPELLPMSKVGVFVDMPELIYPDLYSNQDKRPYLYLYEVECIQSWCYDNTNAPNEFKSLLIHDTIEDFDEETGLVKGHVDRYRYLFINQDKTVTVRFYSKGNGEKKEILEEEKVLNIPKIPFVLFSIPHSLLVDAADYQVALLNIASSDVSYTLKSNFPFYTEQYDARSESLFIKRENTGPSNSPEGGDPNSPEVVVGPVQGRRYASNTDRPGFIHPSSEPLQASMAKQEQLKEEIFLLVDIAIQDLANNLEVSGTSKSYDRDSLEAGLSAIGQELERGEKLIAEYWAMYENQEAAVVKYPEVYKLKTDLERRVEAKETSELISTVPSVTFKKEIAKRIPRILLGNHVSQETIIKIDKEIDSSPGVIATAVEIASDIDKGLVDKETASKIRGYPEGSVKKAHDEYLEKIKLVAESQSSSNGLNNMAARGFKDLAPNTNGAKDEKERVQDEKNLDNRR